jgi:hypothetical protein
LADSSRGRVRRAVSGGLRERQRTIVPAPLRCIRLPGVVCRRLEDALDPGSPAAVYRLNAQAQAMRAFIQFVFSRPPSPISSTTSERMYLGASKASWPAGWQTPQPPIAA